MRISKKAIREKVEYLNGKQGYSITVFERQGLYSRLTVKKYDTELICKVLSNKEISSSRFMHMRKVNFLQNGKERTWDYVKVF